MRPDQSCISRARRRCTSAGGWYPALRRWADEQFLARREDAFHKRLAQPAVSLLLKGEWVAVGRDLHCPISVITVVTILRSRRGGHGALHFSLPGQDGWCASMPGAPLSRAAWRPRFRCAAMPVWPPRLGRRGHAAGRRSPPAGSAQERGSRSPRERHGRSLRPSGPAAALPVAVRPLRLNNSTRRNP